MSNPVTTDAAARLGLALDIADNAVYQRAVARFRDNNIVLPTFSELARPNALPGAAAIDPDAADARNLFRVHWHNDRARGFNAVPDHLELPRALTGVDTRIVLALGDRFPMIGAHKVLAAYACLVPRVVTGRFDPTQHRAVWPSTGNYARGGVAISRIMGCRGVAVLPAGMSQERFDWLDRWVDNPADIIRTPGSESNVKEIYDECARLATNADNVILNQFCEFGNYLAHYHVTGPALEAIYAHVTSGDRQAHLAAFVSASGSGGTLAAGDYLKDIYRSRIVAAEALECPTLLENGYGEHNIQGIGDKHVPLIHNVMNTDIVAAVSDRSTDHLDVLFNTPAGHRYLAAQGVDAATIAGLSDLGLSSICNAIAAIKTAKLLDLGPHDVIVTVATDGAALYRSERANTLRRDFRGEFDEVRAAAVFAEHLSAITTDHTLECTEADRRRIFNLGYYTWVEQQGVAIDDFDRRREQSFWQGLRSFVPAWDEAIREFNAQTGAG